MEERSHAIYYLLLFLRLQDDIVIMYPTLLNTIPGLFCLFYLSMGTVAEIVLIDFTRGTTQVEREIPLSGQTRKNYKCLLGDP